MFTCDTSLYLQQIYHLQLVLSASHEQTDLSAKYTFRLRDHSGIKFKNAISNQSALFVNFIFIHKNVNK